MIDGLLFVFGHPLNKHSFWRTVFRVVWWKCNQLFFKLPAIVSITDSVQCICYPSSSYGSLIVYTTLPEYDEMTYVLDTLKHDSIFVDVGAGLGDYTLLASSKIRNGKIVAFEPHSKAWEQLQANIQLNNLSTITESYQMAVSSDNSFVLFNEEEISEVSSITTHAKNQNAKKIAAVSLDSFLKKRNIKRVSLLKIDVEGAEALVLSGAKNMLKKRQIDQILFEVNPKSAKYEKSAEDVITFLGSHSYTFFKIQNRSTVEISKEEVIDTKITQVILAKLA